MTCVASQGVRILKPYEIVHEIQMLLNFSFKIRGINLIISTISLFNIITLDNKVTQILRSQIKSFFKYPVY